MSRRLLLQLLAKAAREHGMRAARVLSSKLWDEGQRRAIAKGLVDGEVSPQDALNRLKTLYKDGKINKAEFEKLRDDVKVFFRRENKA